MTPPRLPHIGAPFSRVRRDPRRDWFILLAVGLAALVAIVGWHAWAFKTVVSGGTLGGPAPSAAPTSASALDTIGSVLAGRAAEDAAYTEGAYRFADPSRE